MRRKSKFCLGILFAMGTVGAANTNPILSFSTIHTKHQNWLQTQAVLGSQSNQRVVVDSIRPGHLPSDTDSILVLDCNMVRNGQYYFGGCLDGTAKVDVQLWWHSSPLCKNEAGAPPTCFADSMTSLDFAGFQPEYPQYPNFQVYWIPGRVIARGPNGRMDTLIPQLVDQRAAFTQASMPKACIDSLVPSPSLTTLAALDSLRRRTYAGLPVMRIRVDTSRPLLATAASLSDSLHVKGLGLVSSWFAKNKTWNQASPLTLVKGWGAPWTEPLVWLTGRKFYQYDSGFRTNTMASFGTGFLLTNDSTTNHSWYDPPVIDEARDSATVQNDWLILPDSQEVASQKLSRTFHLQCNSPRVNVYSRRNAYPILHDSVVFCGTKLSLASIEQKVGVVSRSGSLPASYQVRSVSQGLVVSRISSAFETFDLRVTSPNGRILSRVNTLGTSALIPIQGHGLMLVEATDKRGTTTLSVLR